MWLSTGSFICNLVRQESLYSSITNYLSALSFFLKSNGTDQIDYSSFVIKSPLKGIRWKLGDSRKQAMPLLPDMLIKIFSFLTLNLGHIFWRAAILCSFRGLLCKAHVTFSDAMLIRKDFKFFKWGMILKIRKSKTIQFTERTIDIPISRCPDLRLCAVEWTQRHFKQLPATPDSPTFLVPSDSGLTSPLSYEI